MAKTWTCPFFKWEEKQKIHCEGGGPAFELPETFREFSNAYCASTENWRKCSLADALVRQYDKEDQDHAKRGQNQKPGV